MNKCNKELIDFVNQNKHGIGIEWKKFEDFILKTPKDRFIIKTLQEVYKTMIKTISRKFVDKKKTSNDKKFLPLEKTGTSELL